MSRSYWNVLTICAGAFAIALSVMGSMAYSDRGIDISLIEGPPGGTWVESLDAYPHDMRAVLPAEQSERRADRLDDTGIRYTVSNQTGQTWRLAVDAYRHIDPGRLSI